MSYLHFLGGDTSLPENDADLMMADPSQLRAREAAGAGLSGAWYESRLPRLPLGSADAATFRTHYDALGAMFADVAAGTAPLAAKIAAASGGSALEQRTASASSSAGAEVRAGKAAAKSEYSHETRAQLTTLSAFRFGLQLLEHERRARNACLNRDPSDTEHLVAAHRSVYPNL